MVYYRVYIKSCMHIGNIIHLVYINKKKKVECNVQHHIALNISIPPSCPRHINPTKRQKFISTLYSAAITPSTPATPAKLNPTPPVTCAPAADEVSSELFDICVEVDVPVASPCELVIVDTTVLLDPLPDIDDEGLAVTLPLATDPDDSPDVIVLWVGRTLPASLVMLVNALPASLLRCDAAALPAVLASEATPAAPLTAVDAAPWTPSAAVDAAPSAPEMALAMLLLLSLLLSWARTAVEERRRIEVRDLRCIFVWR